MSHDTARDARASREAAQWFARMSRLSITTQALRDFRAWRGEPANAEAYARVEAAWEGSARLAGDRDIQRLTDAALARRPGSAKRRRRAISGVAGATVTGLAALIAGGLYAAQWRGTYATGVGEQRLLVLQDGSRVRLNTDSRIRVRFHRHERDVQLLRGEAFFEVKHDSARPFVVAADGAKIRDLGTRFDVRRDEDRVRVTLVQGQVQVSGEGSPLARTLAPDQQVTADALGVSAPAPADVTAQTSWTSGRLVFHAARLDAAVAEVNRYAIHKIELQGPPSLGAQKVSGVFDAGDTTAFVAAAQSLFGLQASRDATGAIRLASPSPAPPA